MSVKSAPFYWVACDHPGCTERSPYEGDEISAWSDLNDALDYASEGDWRRTEAGHDLCPDHAVLYCDHCALADMADKENEE